MSTLPFTWGTWWVGDLLGVLIAYLIHTDNDANFRKWAWIGAAVGLVFWLLLSLL